MAELKCKDGTVIKISDETEKELRKAFEEIYYPVCTYFYRDKKPNILRLAREGNTVFLTYAKSILEGRVYLPRCYGSKEVDNMNKVPFSVIKELTAYPKGLRALNKVKVVEG